MSTLKEYKQIIVGVMLIAAVCLVGFYNWPRENYSVKIVMTSAQNLAVGGKVWINGFDSGWVENIEVRDGKAIVTAGISDDHAPLRQGTRARVQWYAALGERVLTIDPGPASNPAVPDGGLLDSESEQVEVDQILAALDQPTRQKLNGLIDSLHNTTAGKERDVQSLVRSAGPTVQATGQIFAAIGKDGPAVRALVEQLDRMIGVAARQQQDIKGTVNGLEQFSGQLATKQEQLSEALHELPGTLRAANDTLAQIPPSVDPADAMLRDLRGATDKLPGVADDLAPFLRDLRPAVADLRPTVESARDLLERTPALLDSSHVALPKAGRFVHDYQPAISFLRPYTPELVGWIQSWGKNFGVYDSQGHAWSAILGEVSPQVIDEQPVAIPPVKPLGEPKPGEVVGQPWDDPAQRTDRKIGEDAAGGSIR